MKFSIVIFTLLTVLSAGGCQQRLAGELLGHWIGRPDTAAARAEREAEKYGDASAEVHQPSGASDDVTDWEHFDRAVRLHFVNHKRLKMALADAPEWITGTWHIVETSPTGCTIEVETEAPEANTENQQPVATVRRRFQIELDEREGECVGFLLTEVGADRQLGSLYFRRPGKSK